MYLIDNTFKKGSKSVAGLLFLIGLFSQTQISVGGKLGISEFVMVVCAPFVFIRNISLLRRDGSLCFFVLILLWIAGALFVDLYTHNYLFFMLKGIAVPITIFSNSICIYLLLRKNYDNLKWILLGVAISGVISIFVFQRGGSGDVAAEYGLAAGAEAVMGYKLFWVFQLMAWLTLPISGWYQKVPKVYSFLALSFLAIFNLLSGGRSAFLIVSISLLLIIFAGKTRSSLRFIKNHIMIVLISFCFLGLAVKSVYKYAAIHGYMGYEEQAKYEDSTMHGGGITEMLMHGRSEFFIAAFAVLDRPFIGHGSVAIDDRGYVLDFLSKYGDLEAYERIMKIRKDLGVSAIPSHSHIMCYWMWHGFFAFIFWTFVICLAIKTLRSRMHIYPAWFGYFAVTVPMFLWDVFFSPFGYRVQECILFVSFLLVGKLYKEQKYDGNFI